MCIAPSALIHAIGKPAIDPSEHTAAPVAAESDLVPVDGREDLEAAASAVDEVDELASGGVIAPH